MTGCDEGAQGRQRAQQKKDAPPVEVSVLPVRLGQLQRYVDVTGTLHGEEDASISAKVSGRVVAIRKDVGDRVAPGEILAELEKIDYELMVRQRELALSEVLAKIGLKELPPPDFDPARIPTVERAKLQADNATARLNRGKQLHEQNPPLISDQDFADLETAAAVAHSNHEVELLAAQGLVAEARARKADLDLAHQSLIAATIRAPLEGYLTAQDQPATTAATTAPAPQRTGAAADASYTVSSRSITIGEFVKEGTPVFRLVDDNPVKLRATAPERFVAAIRVGQKVQVRVEAYDRDFSGVVSRTNPQIDPANRMFQFEVLVDNPERLLKPGGFARASVMTDVQDNVVFVPHQAVSTFAGVSKVFVVRDGKAAEAIVETGQRVRDDVEIVKGLKGTEQIAVTGVNRLTNGSPVALVVDRASAAE